MFSASDAGISYVERGVHDEDGKTTEQADIYRLIRKQQGNARRGLLQYLEALEPPQALENLVKRLLIEMGYQDVHTTSPGNDKGVDVVADIEVGITQIREVVQVKRRQDNLHRTVLDQLRGSLHRFHAFRGTIITTGGFSKGARDAAIEQGGAPITLIDGQRLIDLLIEHRLGVRKQQLELLELDADSLAFGATADLDD